MSLQQLKKKTEGFTIIEVLIVLAIAGLILLIVFLAVPALQRNSRNTQIKNDAQNISGGVSEYQGANNGKMPTAVAGIGEITFGDGSGNDTKININGSTTATSVTGDVPAEGATGPAGGQIDVYLGKKCNNTDSSRAVAVVYSIETASKSDVRQCIDT